MWVWRDDLGSGAAAGGWRLDRNNTWVWEEPSPLERAGAGVGALRGYAGSAPAIDRRRAERSVRPEPAVGDRALATLGDDPTPIFHELSVDRSRDIPRPSWRDRDRDAVHVPEPHPGSGALPIQDGLGVVPTVPPPPLPGTTPDRGAAVPELAESAEDELRRRAERRRRPLADDRADTAREGGRHTWRREETRTGRHALRR